MSQVIEHIFYVKLFNDVKFLFKFKDNLIKW